MHKARRIYYLRVKLSSYNSIFCVIVKTFFEHNSILLDSIILLFFFAILDILIRINLLSSFNKEIE